MISGRNVSIGLTGGVCAGKSALLAQLVESKFDFDAYHRTEGIETGRAALYFGDKMLASLTLRTVSYDYQEAYQAIIVCFDASEDPDFFYLNGTMLSLKAVFGEDVIILLVGTKVDLLDKNKSRAVVQKARFAEFAEDHECKCLFIDVRDVEQCHGVFYHLAQRLTPLLRYQSTAAINRTLLGKNRKDSPTFDEIFERMYLSDRSSDDSELACEGIGEKKRSSSSSGPYLSLSEREDSAEEPEDDSELDGGRNASPTFVGFNPV